MRRRYEINILPIKHGDKINVSPKAEDLIKEGDIIIAVGHNDDLRKLRSNF